MAKRGDTQTFVVTFTDYAGGSATDADDVTFALLLDGDPYLAPVGVPPVVRDAVGRYRYDWVIPADAPLGVYTAVWTGTLPDETDPVTGYETVTVYPGPNDGPLPDLPDFCWPVDTTCIPDWDATTGTGEDEEPVYTAEEKARAVSMAGQTMRMLTAYRIGGCPITVRPCRARCRQQTWRTYPVGGIGSTPWHPVSLGGRWLNIGCGHGGGGCGCSTIHEVQLHGPASAVTEVKVDGAVLDPTAYRLDPGGLLVRTDGEPWPLCQNMAAPDTEDGTWSVTYTPGAPVDGLGAFAAGLLAKEYLKACTTGACDLPDYVTQIVRQGVSMTLPSGLFPDGLTGIRAVDVYVTGVNPNHLTADSTVWSPDLTTNRRTQ